MTSGIQQDEADTETAETESAVYCRNCDERLMGQFCYVCGQKNIGPRLNSRLLLHNLFEAITDVDSRLWHTLIDMVKKPGAAAKAYIGGARARYINPIQYVIVTFAIYIGFLASVGWLQPQSLEAASITFDTESDGAASSDFDKFASQLVEGFQKVMTEQQDLFLFLTIPIFALLLQGIFRKAKRNFAECLALVCFLFGQINLYGFFIALFQLGLNIPYNGSQGWVVMMVLMQGIRGFFERSWLATIIWGLTCVILLTVVQILVGGLLASANIFLPTEMGL